MGRRVTTYCLCAADDEQLELVADRIKTLLKDANAEIKRTKDLNVTGRLEAVYDEIKLLVDELQ